MSLEDDVELLKEEVNNLKQTVKALTQTVEYIKTPPIYGAIKVDNWDVVTDWYSSINKGNIAL